MDSINRQQPEENHKDLQGNKAGKKIKELVEAAKNSCFFCTKIVEGNQFSTRPMSAQKVDDDGTLWFLSAVDSHKNKHIAEDPAVQLLFQGSPHSDFLTLYGKATITTDKQKIKELWEPLLKVWFTEGENDPRITVIKFVPEDGYYWDTKHSQAVAFAKQLVSAVIGKTLDDSIEGKVNP
jgi:general stress protein 26